MIYSWQSITVSSVGNNISVNKILNYMTDYFMTLFSFTVFRSPSDLRMWVEANLNCFLLFPLKSPQNYNKLLCSLQALKTNANFKKTPQVLFNFLLLNITIIHNFYVDLRVYTGIKYFYLLHNTYCHSQSKSDWRKKKLIIWMAAFTILKMQPNTARHAVFPKAVQGDIISPQTTFYIYLNF